MLLDKVKNLLRKIYIKEEQLLLILIVILGLLVGVVAGLFRASIHFIANHTYLKGGFWIFSPVIGGAVAGFIIRLCREVKGGGVSYVRRMLSYHGGNIPPKVTVLRFVASSINVGSGFSLGPEGPSVSLGGGVGSFLGKIFHLSSRNNRLLVSIGAGSGIAAAFFAPMAGVTYMLEEILGNFSARIIGASFIATVLAAAVQQWMAGHLLMFSVPEFKLLSPYELVYYAVLGLFVAPISVLFIKLTILVKRIFKKHPLPIELKLALVGLIISLTALVFPEAMGTGYETITEYMNMKTGFEAVLALLLVKLVLTAVSVGSDASGGMYAPAFFLGAFSGILVWKIFSLLFPYPIANPGAYAIVGMGAFFGGAFRVPLTAFLLILELTKMNSAILFPLMLATGVSYLFSTYLYDYSATEAVMVEEGSLIPKEAGGILEEILVKDVMRVDYDAVPADFTVREVNEILSLLPFSSYPVIDSDGKYIGMVTGSAIRRAFLKGEGEKKIRELASENVSHLHPEMPLSIAITRLAD
ncbi:MAG TPA: CBS domain-containing protein, partial [candidate division WOR-3 bacterium]|nr:CBS domain-containing protein [candidate division WOR-3 bacterium]